MSLITISGSDLTTFHICVSACELKTNARQHSGCQQNTPGRMRTSLIGKKQSTPNALR
jgi:hypothetical protein